jgi:UPF0716 protein FxsA
MVKWIITAILLFPLAEIVVFVGVAALIGLPLALALMLLTTLAGIIVLRRAGRHRIAHFRVAVTEAGITGIQTHIAGFLTVLAGLLLFLPGFLTDLIGVALLIGPVRRGLGRAFRAWIARKAPADRSVVDLAPGEWRQVPDRELQDKSNRRDRE